MSKYIDAEKLIAEIEKLLAKAKNDEEKAFTKKDAAGHLAAVTKTAVCVKIKKLIATLQQEQPGVCEPEYGPYARQYPKSKVSQEQPEVDLEKYIENEINHYGLSLYEASYGTFSASQIDRIIRNAFELGLNARKEE